MRIGVDLGGTKIEAIALADDGSELVRRRIHTPRDGYQSIVESVATLVWSVEQEIGDEATVGVGTPGAISPTSGLLRNSNSPALNGRPLDADLAQAIGRPIRMANDANCFALSEAVDGAGAGAAVVFGVIIGTGVGGGIAIDAKVLVGPNAIAGEWGHNELAGQEPDTRSCYCGRLNCVERFLAGPAFEEDYERASGHQLGAADIVERVPHDELAAAALERYVQRLARGLATVINVIDPDVIVLGGGMSNIDSLYTDVPMAWGEWVFSDSVATGLLKNHHGDSSGVRGAAWLWS